MTLYYFHFPSSKTYIFPSTKTSLLIPNKNTNNRIEFAGPIILYLLLRYSKLTEYFKRSNINDRKFCKNSKIYRSKIQMFKKNRTS